MGPNNEGKRMDSRRMRMNVEGDRISILPDDLIHKILSIIDIKHAVQTSALSSRWRFIWTSMPHLNFSTENFSKLPQFSKFVTHVLSHRDNQIEVPSVKLSFRGKVSQVFVKRILNYAFSHNVQQLTFSCLLEKKIEFPLSLFISESLKHLTLIGSHSITPASTWDLPALTTLHLDHVTLYNDNSDMGLGLLVKCTNLKSLTLNNCTIMGSENFNICHQQLTNLTLNNGNWGSLIVNVVAPQLKNLNIIKCDGEHRISTCALTSLVYKSHNSLPYFVCNLPHLENASLCLCHPHDAGAQKIVNLLQQFKIVKFLTLSMEIIELLTSYVEVISCQPSPFANLKSLRIYPEAPWERGKESMSSEVKNYLLDSSPNATFTMVSREDIRAICNSTSAQKLMAELRAILDQAGSRPAGKRLPIHARKRTEKIKSCWQDMTAAVQHGETDTFHIMSILDRIEELLIQLPASNRAKMQDSFSSLSTEANTVMNKILGNVKIQCCYEGTKLKRLLS